MPCQVISDYDNCKQFPWNVDGLAEGACRDGGFQI